jgi:hypothetical protein
MVAELARAPPLRLEVPPERLFNYRHLGGDERAARFLPSTRGLGLWSACLISLALFRG